MEFVGLTECSLNELALAVTKDWERVYFGAKPYLAALLMLDSIEDDYGDDSGRDVVAYFLSNATTWRGPTAKIIKSELKRRLEACTQ